jgi:hypothetical protein
LPADLAPANACFFKPRRNRLHVIVTDGRVRNTGVLVRTRNSGENEANSFALLNFSENHFAQRRKQFSEK